MVDAVVADGTLHPWIMLGLVLVVCPLRTIPAAHSDDLMTDCY
jgi:hypothetical protein